VFSVWRHVLPSGIKVSKKLKIRGIKGVFILDVHIDLQMRSAGSIVISAIAEAMRPNSYPA